MQGDRPTRVLVVEDNDDTAQIMRWRLEQLGYDVALAHNGPVALQAAVSFAPDVAVLDLDLPVMDGWELAKRLRAKRDDLRVIAVTGYAHDEARARSAQAGIADHLTKPVDIDALHSAVQRLTDTAPV